MDTYLVVTIIGDDKPGLVELISQNIIMHQGNWLGSRMSRLAGKFAGILKVSVPQINADDLKAALAKLGAHGLKINVEQSAEDDPKTNQKTLKLTILGNDRPGIIKEVSQVLASHKINVDELISDCKSAPMTGELLFDATIEIRMPDDVAIDQVNNDLEQLSNELIVDINLA